MPDNIQPYLLQYLRQIGSGIEGTLHISTDGEPRLFNLYSNGDKLELNNNWDDPDNVWNADNRFVFSLRKSFIFHQRTYPLVFLFVS